MKVLVISPGKKHDAHEGAIIAEYEKRLSGRFDLEWKFIAPDTVEKESAAIMKPLANQDFVVLLDERGRKLSSADFARTLGLAAGNGSKRIVFIIGGAYGVNETVKKRANLSVCISNMTLPHRLVRILLAEQIYRAAEITRGGKYHHA